MSRRVPKLAIYDVPDILGKKLTKELQKAGYSVLFEGGVLDEKTARPEADIWLAKWTFKLKSDFLSQYRPRQGIVTLSVGMDHIDREAVNNHGLKLENCPSSASVAVAEHALTLAFGGLFINSQIPPVRQGTVIFRDYSDEYAESVIGQILLYARQLRESRERAGRFEYMRRDARKRHDEPWTNNELSHSRIGIVGKDSNISKLANMLKFGFDCELLGCESFDYLDIFGATQKSFAEVMIRSDYVFLLTARYGSMLSSSVAADALEKPKKSLYRSKVGVLGTGRIGSIIARMARGFNCDVTAYDEEEGEALKRIGVRYVEKGKPEDAIVGRDFVFIALPLNQGTRQLIGRSTISRISAESQTVIVNVTRDEIIDSEALIEALDEGRIYRYATDVLPDDKNLWSQGNPKPRELTRRFVEHPSVIATPHEGDASARTMARFVEEAKAKIEIIINGS